MATIMSHSAQLELTNWCRGEGISPKHALMLHGVSEDEDVSVIEETVQTTKALGKVRVRGKVFDTKNQTVTVLCECREEVDASKIPPEVIPLTGGAQWTIVIAQPQENRANNFSEKLARFLQDEGKTMEISKP